MFFIVLIALIPDSEGGKKKKKKGGSPKTSEAIAKDMLAEETADDDDDEEDEDGSVLDDVNNFGSRKDCVDDDELEDCSDECEHHNDCRRESFNMECDSTCGAMCAFIEKNAGIKCEMNLAAIVADYRID